MAQKRIPLSERLWGKVEKRGPGECWPWMAGVDRRGYGRIREAGTGSRTLRAHRVSYALHKGAVPPDMLVCHRCDNPRCVNPDHLFLGTHAENIADRDQKGRAAPREGTNNPAAKITPETVRAIRAAGGTCDELAARFGITRSQISNIKRQKNWAHVT